MTLSHSTDAGNHARGMTLAIRRKTLLRVVLEHPHPHFDAWNIALALNPLLTYQDFERQYERCIRRFYAAIHRIERHPLFLRTRIRGAE